MKYETKVCICGIKVSKSRKQFYRRFDSPKKRTKFTILSKKDAHDCEFRSLFGRIRRPQNAFEIY